jgi:hypothetical protein
MRRSHFPSLFSFSEKTTFGKNATFSASEACKRANGGGSLLPRDKLVDLRGKDLRAIYTVRQLAPTLSAISQKEIWFALPLAK